MSRVALALVVLAACSDSPPKPKKFTPDHPAEVKEPPPPVTHVAAPKKHAIHEHAHGAHPHPGSDHHHHPHPHPHLDGPDGHHHPF